MKCLRVAKILMLFVMLFPACFSKNRGLLWEKSWCWMDSMLQILTEHKSFMKVLEETEQKNKLKKDSLEYELYRVLQNLRKDRTDKELIVVEGGVEKVYPEMFYKKFLDYVGLEKAKSLKSQIEGSSLLKEQKEEKKLLRLLEKYRKNRTSENQRALVDYYWSFEKKVADKMRQAGGKASELTTKRNSVWKNDFSSCAAAVATDFYKEVWDYFRFNINYPEFYSDFFIERTWANTEIDYISSIPFISENFITSLEKHFNAQSIKYQLPDVISFRFLANKGNFQIPLEYDFKGSIIQNPGKYELFGIISYPAGHYNSSVKHGNGDWYFYDDVSSTVEHMTELKGATEILRFHRGRADMVFYQRVHREESSLEKLASSLKNLKSSLEKLKKSLQVLIPVGA